MGEQIDDLKIQVDQLRDEFEIQHSIKDVTNSLGYRIQQSRDKICDVLRRIQNRRDNQSVVQWSQNDEQQLDGFMLDYKVQKQIEKEQQEKEQQKIMMEQKTAEKQSEIMRQRRYIKEFKKYLEQKRTKTQQEEQELANELKIQNQLVDELKQQIPEKLYKDNSKILDQSQISVSDVQQEYSNVKLERDRIKPKSNKQINDDFIQNQINKQDLGIAFHPERLVDSMISVPKALSCERRVKSPSRREQWVKALIEDKQQRDAELHKYIPFIANSVPNQVKNRNGYAELVQISNIRRKFGIEKSIEESNQRVRPFNFEERDKQRRQKVQIERQQLALERDLQHIQQFKAVPAPWFCQVKLIQRIERDKAKAREMRKNMRKNWLILNSKMPARMQQHVDDQNLKIHESNTEKGEQKMFESEYNMNNGNFTFYPRNQRQIPDFDKLHQQTQQQLEKLKKQKKITKPNEPNLSRVSKKQLRIDQQQQLQQQQIQLNGQSNQMSPLSRAKQTLSKQPKKQTKLTKKFLDQMKSMGEKRQQKQQLQIREYFEEQQRQERKQLFVPRVQNSWVITENQQMAESKRIEKWEQIKQNQREQEQDFKEMMKNIFLRVYQRPLLMEQVNNIDNNNEQQQEYDQEQIDQNEQYGYNHMNPIGEDDELEYMKQQQEEGEEDDHDDDDYQDQENEQIDGDINQNNGENQIHRLSNQLNEDDEQQDPEGVDEVGDEAEQSTYEDVEFAKDDYNNNNNNHENGEYDNDGEDDQEEVDGAYDFIDPDNIDPELLKQLQEQALAQGYNLDLEGYDDEGDQEYDDYNENHQKFQNQSF